MSAPYKRRRDPTPMTQGWEIAVAGIGLALIVLALAALSGVGAAAAMLVHWGVPGPGEAVTGMIVGGGVYAIAMRTRVATALAS